MPPKPLEKHNSWECFECNHIDSYSSFQQDQPDRFRCPKCGTIGGRGLIRKSGNSIPPKEAVEDNSYNEERARQYLAAENNRWGTKIASAVAGQINLVAATIRRLRSRFKLVADRDVDRALWTAAGEKYSLFRLRSLLMWYTFSENALTDAVAQTAQYNQPNGTRLLLRMGASPTATSPKRQDPLYTACYHKSVDCVKVLLEAGADARSMSPETKETPLHTLMTHVVWVANENDPKHLNTSRNRHDVLRRMVKIIDLLVIAGADVNAQQVRGATPLMYATLENATPVVERLLEHRADPDLKDCGLLTPLFEACRQGFFETARALVKGGARREPCPVNANLSPYDQHNVDAHYLVGYRSLTYRHWAYGWVDAGGPRHFMTPYDVAKERESWTKSDHKKIVEMFNSRG